MSRQGTAWSVKGVDQATRDIARRASQAAGLTIGEWIDQAIRADAEARGEVQPPADAAPPPRPDAGRVSLATLDGLAARLDEAEGRLEAALRPVAYALQDIAERLVELEQRAERRPAPVARIPLPPPVEGADHRGTDAIAAPEPDWQEHRAEPDTAWIDEPDEDLGEELGEDLGGDLGEDLGDPGTSRPGAAAPDRVRPLPDAPPAGWEPVLWIPHGDLAREAEAMRLQRLERATAPADPEPGPEDTPAAGSAFEPASEPDLLAELRLDDEAEALRFDEPDAPSATPVPQETLQEPARQTLPEDFDDIRQPADPDAATPRPEPVPPTGDLPFDAAGISATAQDAAAASSSGEDTVPAWLSRQMAIEAPATSARPDLRRRPPRRRWWAAAAALLLLVAAPGAWWLATGGGAPSVEAVRDRLAAGTRDVRDGAATVLDVVQDGADRLAGEVAALVANLVTPSAPEPEAPAAMAAPVSSLPAAPQPPARPESADAPAPAPEQPRASEPAVPAPAADAAPKAAPVPAPVPAPVAEAPAEPAPAEPAPAEPAPAKPARAAPPPAPSLAADPPSDSPAASGDQTAALPPATAEPGAEALLAEARAGDPRAQYTLAARMAAASPPDYTQAANWFREAAIQGVANAQYNLGVLYDRGLGVPQDDTRALLWYHSAAEQGHALAQYNLGVLYSAGRGIPLSYAEAGRWFRRAADHGVPAALYNLAILTEGGLGVARDAAEAERLLRRAAELGHPGARTRLAAGGTGAAAAPLADTASTVTDAGVAPDDVVAIQKGLSRLGLYDGPVDGIAGPRTRDAITRYQAREALPQTGLPSAALRKRLGG